jgi:hypothetical protein
MTFLVYASNVRIVIFNFLEPCILIRIINWHTTPKLYANSVVKKPTWNLVSISATDGISFEIQNNGLMFRAQHLYKNIYGKNYLFIRLIRWSERTEKSSGH